MGGRERRGGCWDRMSPLFCQKLEPSTWNDEYGSCISSVCVHLSFNSYSSLCS